MFLHSNLSDDDSYFTTLNRDFSYYNEELIDPVYAMKSYEKVNDGSRKRNPLRVVKNVVGWAIGRIRYQEC